ncbi:C40 family peptidase [Nocardia sp. 348MFTsu5.1]|uniref:C40 family peptidase n=1 Tax=Nocardia sp. 348MFTsu5.1 TaxID=1172185 RepID=UPI00037A26B5|nr:C40 family peptidase [Nocardia sp. 348MFTsu5.1]
MIPVEILIAPLQTLLTTLGTGVLPGGAPTTQLRTIATILDDSRASQVRTNEELKPQWSGVGANSAIAVLEEAVVAAAGYSDDSLAIADVIDSAADKVRRAALELEGILDAFVTIAAAMGPTLFSPAGIAAILPVAMDHVQRGIDVVERTRTELSADTDRLLQIGRTPAPADTDSVVSQLARVGTELGNLSNAAFGPIEAGTQEAATQSDAVQNSGAAQTLPAGLSATNTNGTGVAITLPDGSVAYAPNERAAKAVRAALSQQGVPYVWGGTTPGVGLDCSGLTQWAYREAGVELPRLAQDQDTAGVAVSQADLQPGDLAVWSGHVAMYVGNGQMVEAGDPVSVSAVRTTNLDQTFEGFYRPT